MSKKLLLLLALALLLGVSVFSIWKQSTIVTPPTPEPVVSPESTPEPTPSDQPIDTSDWKTYRNEEYGFEFKYPREYQVFDDYPENKTIFISLPENSVHRVPGVFIHIGAQAVSLQMLLEQIHGSSRQMKHNMLHSNTSIYFGLNNEIPAKKIVYSAEIGYDVTNYLFSVNNMPFQIEVRIPIPFSEGIINSFKLTND